MADKDKKPQVRFKGYSDDWKQQELGEIATFSKGQGYSKKDLADVGTPIILYGRLYTKYQTVISEVDTFVMDKPDSIYSFGNEVIVPASGETAKDIARASAVRKSGILLGGDLNIISPSEYIDSAFLAMSISNGEQQKELAKRAQGKSVVHLRNADLKEVMLFFPSNQEQEKISKFITGIDKLITLHQRKYENLKNIKKSMLEKMFPKNGTDVPEIRFKGFTDAWEQYKLADITYYSGVKNSDNVPYESYSISNVNGFVPQEEQFEHGGTMRDADKSMYYIVSPQSFAYNPARINVGSIGYQNQSKSVIVSSLYEVFKTTDQCDDGFLRYWIKTEYFQKLIEQYQEGGVRLYFYYDKFCKGNINLPCIEEQQKIGIFFNFIDKLINLQHLELEKLKSIKKACLEKMFV